LALKTIGIAIFSISMLISFGLTSNQAFAGITPPTSCEECDFFQDEFDRLCINNSANSQSISLECEEILQILENCRETICPAAAVGGDMIQMQTTSVLAAGAQYTAAWMIPVIVSAIGIAIVIARKF